MGLQHIFSQEKQKYERKQNKLSITFMIVIAPCFCFTPGVGDIHVLQICGFKLWQKQAAL